MNERRRVFGQPDIVRFCDEDDVAELLEHSITTLWDTLGSLTRLRRTTRSNYRVTIFGSARLAAGSVAYQSVKELAGELSRLGCDIITGGGPGLMQAANEGASLARSASAGGSYGIRVDLPFEQELNPFVAHGHEHRTFFSRLHHFMLISDAIVVTPGGIGSLLELSMAWQLLQVGHLQGVPLILVGKMWSELVEWARQQMLDPENPLASPKDFDVPVLVRSVPECVETVRRHREEWLRQQRAEVSA